MTISEDAMAARCVAEIKRQLELQDINASGRTSASLDYEAEEGRVVVFAEGEHAPITTLQEGAGPHVNPEPEGFDEAIRAWVAIRFSGESPVEQRRIAGAVAHKIRKEGTKLYREHKRSGIPREVYTPALTELVDSFTAVARERLAEVIGKAIDRTL